MEEDLTIEILRNNPGLWMITLLRAYKARGYIVLNSREKHKIGEYFWDIGIDTKSDLRFQMPFVITQETDATDLAEQAKLVGLKNYTPPKDRYFYRCVCD